MTNTISTRKFYDSEAATKMHEQLEALMESPDFNTASTYSPASAEMINFVDKHMKYLSVHPTLNHDHYLSNLKLKTRIS